MNQRRGCEAAPTRRAVPSDTPFSFQWVANPSGARSALVAVPSTPMARRDTGTKTLASTLDTALDAAGRKLLAEALRRGAEAADTAEDAILGFGRWLLVSVFDDDAAAALDDRAANPVWRELLRRAGGPTLRVSERMLYVALHVAARDKRIGDEAWRALDVGRKELLLPLGDEHAMRKAAQHVAAMKLSLRATREYVAALRAEQGAAPKARVTPERVVQRVRRFNKLAGDEASARRSLAALQRLEGDARRDAETDLRQLRDWAAAMLRGLRDR